MLFAKHIVRLVVLTAAFANLRAAWATSTWTDSSGGLWNDVGNWSGVVPSADTALFDLNSTYTVIFDISPSITGFDVRNGTVTFALAGRTLTTTGTSFLGFTGQTGRLTV